MIPKDYTQDPIYPNCLSKRFICYSNGCNSLDAVIRIDKDTETKQIDVFDHDTRYKFASWYLHDENNNIVDICYKNIQKEMDKLNG